MMSPTGDMPSSAGGAIYVSLRQYAKAASAARAYPDNVAFVSRFAESKVISVPMRPTTSGRSRRT